MSGKRENPETPLLVALERLCEEAAQAGSQALSLPAPAIQVPTFDVPTSGLALKEVKLFETGISPVHNFRIFGDGRLVVGLWEAVSALARDTNCDETLLRTKVRRAVSGGEFPSLFKHIFVHGDKSNVVELIDTQDLIHFCERRGVNPPAFLPRNVFADVPTGDGPNDYNKPRLPAAPAKPADRSAPLAKRVADPLQRREIEIRAAELLDTMKRDDVIRTICKEFRVARPIAREIVPSPRGPGCHIAKKPAK